jgi:predicted GIY-YIG superfamily endonuclease
MSDTQEGADGGGPRGTVYLIHLDPPYKHARHYTGWTANLDQRLAEHRAGIGARLLDVAQKAGGSWHLVRTWPGTKKLERAIKDTRAVPRLCPECSPHPDPLTRGRAARLVDRPADLTPGPPPLHAFPGLDTRVAIEPQPSPAPELVPIPDPGAEPASIWPGRPAGPEACRDLVDVTDKLISGWRAELDAGTGPPAPGPGRLPPRALVTQAAAEPEIEIEP